MTRNVKQEAIRQLTIRGFDPDLERKIRELAESEDLSLNQAVMRLLRRGAGLKGDDSRERVGDSLDRFIGRWNESEAREFGEATKDFERIDESFWK